MVRTAEMYCSGNTPPVGKPRVVNAGSGPDAPANDNATVPDVVSLSAHALPSGST